MPLLTFGAFAFTPADVGRVQFTMTLTYIITVHSNL